jgi:hypothetical protein
VPLVHENSAPFAGDPTKALDFALGVLAGQGFRLTYRTPTSIAAVGPGMNNTRESPLRGASAVRLESRPGRLALNAELGGVEWMGKFLTWFPNILCFGLGVVLTIVFLLTMGPGWWIAIVACVVAADGMLWLLLGPFIAKHLEAKTRNALDTLLVNAAGMG